MKEILTIFMDYCGSGIYPFLFLLSLVYLFATEKDRKIRLVLLETSAVILLLFFFPLFKMAMDQVEEAGTYYRILWLLPMTVVTAYAGVPPHRASYADRPDPARRGLHPGRGLCI